MSKQDYTDLNIDKRKSQLLESVENYRIILEINNAIISNLNLNNLLQAIATIINEKLPFDYSAICLYEPNKDIFVVYSFGKEMALLSGFELPREGSHSGWVFDNNKPVFANDLSKVQKFSTDNILLERNILSYIVTPLVSRNNTIGTLNLGYCTPNKFEGIDIDFLSLVSKQVALALDNAKSHEQIENLKNKLEMENVSLQEEIKTTHNFEEIIGASSSLKNVLKNVERVAETDATVLLRGETGTGKELIARSIHNSSKRSVRSLVKINCPAIPDGLIESELFGHEKGAFTGALSKRIGKFELADGGTIFLDELGDLPLNAQAKLLRVLQEREFERVGGNETIKVDVRVIAATNRDLEAAVKEGKFRADLFYRLNVFPIDLPPLRDRLDDIIPLSHYILQKCNSNLGKTLNKINEDTIKKIKEYHWPGNIRELENIIERAAILSTGDVLHINENLLGQSKEVDLGNKESNKLEDVERDHIINILNQTLWRIHGKNGAALILGMNPSTLRARMTKLGIKKKTVLQS